MATDVDSDYRNASPVTTGPALWTFPGESCIYMAWTASCTQKYPLQRALYASNIVFTKGNAVV